MSEVDTQPRDEAGKFTPDTTGMFGQELANADMGFKTRPRDESADDKSYTDDLSGVQEAGRDLALKRAGAPAKVEIDLNVVREELGVKPDITEAVTAEQAAKDLSAYRGVTQTYVDGANLSSIAEQVDKARAEALKAGTKAEDLGLSEADVEAAKKADGEKDAKADDGLKAKSKPDPVAVEGLDPEVERAFKLPQVRAAVEEVLGSADQSRQQYADAVNYANQFAQASLVDALPELAQIPLENWEAAIGLLAQSDPQRVQRAIGIIQRVSNLSGAQMQLQQQQAHVQRQQFIASTEQEDSKLVSRLGEDVANEANKATVSFLVDHGVPRHETFQFVQRHPVLATSEAREVLWKASQYDKMQQSAKTMQAQPLPPVQRPGTQSSRPARADNGSKIAALQAQLANASGDKAARIAGQIRNLRRSG